MTFKTVIKTVQSHDALVIQSLNLVISILGICLPLKVYNMCNDEQSHA